MLILPLPGGLKVPEAHVKARDRALKAKKLTQNKRARGGGDKPNKAQPKGITASDRLRETLIVTDHRTDEKFITTLAEQSVCKNRANFSELWCQCCARVLRLKSSQLLQHLNSENHQNKLGVWSKRDAEGKKDALDALRAYQLEHEDCIVDSTDLDEDTKVRRIEVVENHVRKGVPLGHLDDNEWRLQLEGGSLPSLAGADVMRQLVPVVRQKHIIKAKKVLEAAVWIFASYDGQSRQGELVCIVLYCIDITFKCTMLVIRMCWLKKSLCGEELGMVVVQSTYQRGCIQPPKMAGTSNDKCGINLVAQAIIRPFYPNSFPWICMPHTYMNCGEQYVAPLADRFLSEWLSMHTTSHLAGILWKKRIGNSDVRLSASATRWWAKMECELDMCQYSPDVQPFLCMDLAEVKDGPDKHAEVSPAHRKNMLTMLADDTALMLPLQQMARHDTGDGLLKATYNSEKEGPVITSAYKDFLSAEACLKREALPTADAFARKTANKPTGYDVNCYMQMKQAARAVVAPVIAYFDSVFHVELKDQMAVLKACAWIDPVQAEEQQPKVADLNVFSLLPMVQQRPALLAGIKAQLPQYLAEVSGMSKVGNIYKWWNALHEAEKIPAWVELSRYVLVLRPHAAGPERIFSRVRQTFGDTQHGALEDEIETAMMAQVNTYTYE